MPVLLLSLVCLLPACGAGISALGDQGFRFSYRLQRGLDCSGTGDCGFLVEVSSAGEVVRYDLPGTGPPVLVAQGTLLPEERTALFELLRDNGFFELPTLVPEADPVAGGGTVLMAYDDPATGTSRQVRVMLGAGVPAAVRTMMDQVQAFLLARVG